jgi:isocitrate lyase
MTDHDASSVIGTNWAEKPRWAEIKRPYMAADVIRLRGSLQIEYTLARNGAERLWNLFQSQPYVAALGATTGNQAIEQVSAGLSAIYATGWQVAADVNAAREMYPHESLSPSDSVPNLVRSINKSLQRADQIHHAEGRTEIDWFAPVVADAEAGLGGNLNSFELMKAMIEAGAAAVHFEDQLSIANKCGHMGGKVVVPVQEFIEKLIAARLAADVMGVPTLLIARTDANTARLITYDADSRDRKFITEERTPEGYFGFRGGLEAAIARGLAYAPYADLLWCETSAPDLKEAQRFSAAIHEHFPGKLLAYNCSASFNWVNQLDATTIRNFQVALSAMGYKFQFVNLAGFHSLNLGMFDLARDFRETGMAAYVRLQQSEFDLAESYGYEAVSHQRFVGRGYFDDVAQTIAGGASPTTVLNGSADQTQFSSPSSRLRPQEPRSSTRKRRTMPISGGDGYKDNEGIN